MFTRTATAASRGFQRHVSTSKCHSQPCSQHNQTYVPFTRFMLQDCTRVPCKSRLSSSVQLWHIKVRMVSTNYISSTKRHLRCLDLIQNSCVVSYLTGQQIRNSWKVGDVIQSSDLNKHLWWLQSGVGFWVRFCIACQKILTWKNSTHPPLISATCGSKISNTRSNKSC